MRPPRDQRDRDGERERLKQRRPYKATDATHEKKDKQERRKPLNDHIEIRFRFLCLASPSRLLARSLARSHAYYIYTGD